MRIAVGFDGTIVKDKYPKIGHAKPFAIRVIRRLTAEGHAVILWTTRSGAHLDEAKRWCRKHGLEFYAINSNHPDYAVSPSYPDKSPKVSADIYIDGANLGGIPNWIEVYRLVSRKNGALE